MSSYLANHLYSGTQVASPPKSSEAFQVLRVGIKYREVQTSP